MRAGYFFDAFIFFFDTCLHRHVVSIPVATRETLFVLACGHICHSHELFRRDATRLIPALWAEEAPFETVSTQANIDHKCKQEHKRNRTNQPTIHPTTTTTPCKSESLAAKRCKYQSKPSNPKKREKIPKKTGKNPKKNCSPFIRLLEVAFGLLHGSHRTSYIVSNPNFVGSSQASKFRRSLARSSIQCRFEVHLGGRRHSKHK